MTQQITKDFALSYRELLGKIAQKNETIKKLKAKCSLLSKKSNRQVCRIAELKESRDKLRAKNKVKSNKVKYLTKKAHGVSKPKGHQYSSLLITLSVLLRSQTGISYRHICTVLELLKLFFELPDSQIPCANTLQNWTSKSGYNLLEKGDSNFLGKSVVAIVDESIQLGNYKMLLVLLAPAQKLSNQALCFQDIRIAYIGYCQSWTAQKISACIDKTVKKFDLSLAYILSDQDSKLVKSAALSHVSHLPDISHAVATSIRKSYEKQEQYQRFIKLISSYQCKGVNQDLTYLIPPNQRTKARFMNQHAMVGWAETMLSKFDHLSLKEQVFFQALPQHKPIIESLAQCLQVAQKVSKSLKEEGFSMANCIKITQYLSQITSIDRFAQYFMGYLKAYLNKYHDFLAKEHSKQQLPDMTCINVCSDVIESMFGKYKSKISDNKLTSVSYIALELPLYSLDREQLCSQIVPSIEKVSVAKIKAWKEEYNIENQSTKRCHFFKKLQKK